MMKILGLAIGNGCTALASVLSQQAESANIQSSTGMVVMALASVIIGANLFRKVKFLKATTKVILGSIVYKACLTIAMQLGLPTNFLKLLMAVIFTIAWYPTICLPAGGKSKMSTLPRFEPDFISLRHIYKTFNPTLSMKSYCLPILTLRLPGINSSRLWGATVRGKQQY